MNRNTVLRAYRELHAEGTLVLRQGREATIARRSNPRANASARIDGDAETLAAQALTQAEIRGCDGVRFAELITSMARELDRAHPRYAFVECSHRQADQLASLASSRLGRHVVGICLDSLCSSGDATPASIRYLLVPHWHVAEARKFCGNERKVFAIRLRLSPECERRLRGLTGSIALVVRDAESVPGYAALVGELVNGGPVQCVSLDDDPAVRDALEEAEHIVCTPPCTDRLDAHAGGDANLVELEFEPDAQDLAAFSGACMQTTPLESAVPALHTGPLGDEEITE